VNETANDLMLLQQARWRDLKAELAGEGIHVCNAKEVDPEERAWLQQQFLDRLFPVLTPLAIDPAHPFPFIPNLGFSLALKLRRQADGKPLTPWCPCPPRLSGSGPCRSRSSPAARP
jgi:polyphosphate kinase